MSIKLIPGKLPSKNLNQELGEFKKSHGFNSKGQIATMLFASRLVRNQGLPFDIENGVVTKGEGQVKGLSKGSVQAILATYGIATVLAEEGGRTSRGSLGNIKIYLEFLNRLAPLSAEELASIEAWWVNTAKQFFNAKPFRLRFESGKSLRYVLRDLIGQARKRQAEGAGTMFVGAMLQHLVGAKLELALPECRLIHHGYSVADAVSGRSGDFHLGNAALHVTTAPGEAVIRKCVDNLAAGLQPIIVTFGEMIPAADAFASAQEIADRIDVLDVEQFIVANLYEIGGFETNKRRVTVERLISRYNDIVTVNETDPSLKIQAI
jgi:Domain of unknown function (DUF4928)